MLSKRLVVFVLFLVSYPISAQTPTALGPEFSVDGSPSPNSRRLPAVAFAPEGDFMVVWVQDVTATDQKIFGRRFLANGTPNGASSRIDTNTGPKNYLAIAALPGGKFIVAWEEVSFIPGLDNSGSSVHARIYGAGSEFQVNTFTELHQGRPTVAALPSGGFVIAWQSDGSNGDDHSATSIQAQRFDSNGTRLGPEIQVDTYTLGDQFFPFVSVGLSEFVVAWQSSMSDGDNSGRSIRARRFSTNGQPLGDDFQINTFTIGDQRSVSLAMGPGNEVFFVWTSGEQFLPGPDGSYSSVQGRRFGDLGTPLGGEFQINTQTQDAQSDPAISRGANGDFIVLWFDRIEPGDSTFLPGGIRGQYFNEDGSRRGPEFALNTYIPNAQDSPDVAARSGGDFVAVWRSVGQDADGSDDIIGRRFLGSGRLFADSFESGNISHWD
jgi:hypothetical protein